MCVYRILISRLPPDLAPLLLRQVAGFHRAVPSTALDKACMQFLNILSFFMKKSRHFSTKTQPNLYKSDIDFFPHSC